MDLEKLDREWGDACRHLTPEQVALVKSGKPLDSAQMKYARRSWFRLVDAVKTYEAVLKQGEGHAHS